MSPWQSAAQYGGRLDRAFEHIAAYKAAASHITLDDFVDDDDDHHQQQQQQQQDNHLHVTSSQPFTQTSLNVSVHTAYRL